MLRVTLPREFEPRVLRVVDDYIEDAVTEVAMQGQAHVHDVLNARIRKPTPYYETQITTDRVRPDLAIVNDRGVVYGPWLEGISERNRRTSFKGYHAFRLAKQNLTHEIPTLTAPILQRHLGRL